MNLKFIYRRLNFSVMFFENSTFGNTKLVYDLTFIILSIEFDSAKKKEDLKDLSVGIRFAEKCLIIHPINGIVGRKDKNSRDSSKPRPSAKSGKLNVSLPFTSSNEADDEATDDGMQSNWSLLRESKVFTSSRTERAQSSRRETVPSSNVNSAVSIFGSKTERFECTPACLAEKFAKNLIKYELQRESELIGSSSNCFTRKFF